jgi:two-component sensor histidine kinase
MISNSLKHAFKENFKGVLTVNLSELSKGSYELIVGDNGIGRSDEDFKKKTFGNELIEIFCEQMGGKLTHIDSPGTFYKINFNKLT